MDKDFVGHRKAVTCVRFSNNIYERNVQGKPAMYLYMAIGEHYSALLYGIYVGTCFVFCLFFGGLECVGHSIAYVARFIFLRDIWIRTQRAAIANRRATNIATHLPGYILALFIKWVPVPDMIRSRL